jgi:hypothetical protein
MCDEGEGRAICQVADRLDGKPAQDSNVSIQHRRAEELTDEELAAIAAGELATAVPESSHRDVPKSRPAQANISASRQSTAQARS